MKKTVFLLAVLLAAIASVAASKPNIILFYVDDLGWMDLGVQGSELYETPNIDRLAAEGVRFTQGYTPHPRCLPARYGIITGCFPARGGVPGGNGHLQPDDRTLAQALSEGGYQTCFVGKWHLTGTHGEQTLPQNMGFHVNIAAGAAGSPSNYFFPYRKKPTAKLKPGWEIGLDKEYIHGLEDTGKDGDYLTDILTEKSIEFIEANVDTPFFLYLSHYGVHTPFQAPERLVKKYEAKLANMTFEGPEHFPVSGTGVGEEKAHQNNAVYAAMIESVDESLGQIFQTLEKLDLTDNTVIVLTADNGGLSNRGNQGWAATRPLATSNKPLRTGKGWLYEGGIREPFIVKWPGVTKAGTVNEHDVVIGTDLFPTFLEMADLPPEPKTHRDGISIVAALKDEPFERDKPLFWHSPSSRPYATGDTDNTAVRLGDYKLLEWYNADHVELYDLSKDIGEQNDLSRKRPEKTAELLKLIHDWRKEINAHTSEQIWGKSK